MKFEQVFDELVSTNTKDGSSSPLFFDDNSKSHETDTQSVKSEISTEGNQSIEMATTKKHLNHLNSPEDGLVNTESSSSNSLSVVVRSPVSNHSYQETCKDAYSFKNRGSSMDSSNSQAFDFSLDELMTTNSESGLSAQIARKAMRNARTRNRMKVTSMAENDNTSLLTKKGDIEILSSVSSDNFCANESSDFSMKKPRKVDMGFDLNEDTNADEMDDCIKPCHGAIRVVAKPGILSGRPVFPLKFEGVLGWKGHSETSAFRPTVSSYRKTCFTGIDLNVAAAGEDVIPLPSVFQDSEKKDKGSLLIDLNCIYDAAADEYTQPKLEYSPLIDLNLNVNTSIVDKSSNKRAFDYSMQHCGPMELMQRVPNLPLVSNTSTPFSYSSNGPFHFSSGDPLPAGALPYARFTYEQGILPRVFNSGPLHTSFDSPHHMQVAHEPTRIDVSREFSFLEKKSSMGERAKRNEPEGGFGCYYKQII
ncbi:hypothetical protein ABFS83_03G123400 [Erythranthe nasuta]